MGFIIKRYFKIIQISYKYIEIVDLVKSYFYKIQYDIYKEPMFEL